MPAAYIHENITKKALEKVKNSPSYIANNMHAYIFGAQGPDFLFYYNVIAFWDKDTSPNDLGNKMHNKKVNEFFRVILKSAKEQGVAAMAWAVGFVTHYAADTTIHPFVYARTNNPDGSRNGTKHLCIEAQFDTWYYRLHGKKGVPRQVKCIKKMTKEQKSEIARALEAACAKVYPEYNLSAKQAYKSIGDMNNLVSILYSPLKIKHWIFLLIEKMIKKPQVIICHEVAQKLPEYDFLNLNKDTWTNPWDKSVKSDKSIPELFDMATKRATKYSQTVIDFFEGNVSIDDAAFVLGNDSYASGLPIKE